MIESGEHTYSELEDVRFARHEVESPLRGLRGIFNYVKLYTCVVLRTRHIATETTRPIFKEPRKDDGLELFRFFKIVRAAFYIHHDLRQYRQFFLSH